MAEILDAVVSGRGLNPTALSRELGWSRTTVYRILQTLVDLEILTSSYQPGPRLIRWAYPVTQKRALDRISRDTLQRLVAKFRDTASVYIRIGASRVCIARQEGLEALRHTVHVGLAVPLHVGSAGRILLAWLDEQERNALIRESIALSGFGASSQEPDWEAIRAHGWAMTEGERDSALASVSVPIRDGDKAVVAALSISGPRHRFTLERVNPMVQALREEALHIERNLDPS